MDSAGDAGPSAQWTVPGYRHERELGSGASGKVMLARHDETGTAVAIKYLVRSLHADSDFRAAYRAEAALLGELTSPHVARLYEYVESEHGAAIVMELVDGVPLRVLLRAEGATTPEAALVVLKGSLLGLAAAHGAGVVHRDYKPENVLVTPEGVSKLVDFGIAARSGAVGVAAGTPLYMAPEQFAGEPAAPAADVYAATATFFECVTGDRPYSGTTVMELMVQHTQSPIPDELAPERLRPLIRSGLAKSPRERPAGAAAFVDELERVARAAYGEDWEERGQRKLATLLAMLPLLLLTSPTELPSGTTALATTDLGVGRPARRLGSRAAKAAIGAGAALAVIGAVAALASAANGSGSPPAAAGYHATTGATTLVVPTQSTGPQPVSAATAASPTASATPSGSSSPSVDAAQATPSPTAQPTSSQPTTTATATGSASPSPSPVLHVASVTITSSGCSGRQGMLANVTVKSDGAAAGTLYLAWYYTDTAGGPRTFAATDPVALPVGKTTFSNSTPYYHVFGSTGVYWGVQVSTKPAAARGNDTTQTVLAQGCEIQ